MLQPRAGDPLSVSLYTDSFVVRGTIDAPSGLEAALNAVTGGYLVLRDASCEEFGSQALIERADHVQANLGSVMFAVADDDHGPLAERAGSLSVLVSMPAFRLTGRLQLAPGEDLSVALPAHGGDFLGLRGAVFWSDLLHEPRTPAPVVAFSRSRAHLVAPFSERDVWSTEGLSRAAAVTESVIGPDETWRAANDNDPWRGLK